MKKVMLLALGALLAASVSAQEPKRECPQLSEKVCPTKEQRIEMDIKHFIHELYLSDKQAENFANTYRDYATKLDDLRERMKPAKPEEGKTLSDKELDKQHKQRIGLLKELAELRSKYYDKFRKDLNPRQVEKVLRLNEPFDCCGAKCGKPGMGNHAGHGPQFDMRGPRPEGHGHRPDGHGHGKPAPQGDKSLPEAQQQTRIPAN